MDSRTDTKPQGSNGLFSVDNLTDNSAPTEVAEQPKLKRPVPQPVNNIFSEGNLKKKADGSGSSMPSTQPTSTSVPPSTLPTENNPANPLLSGQRPQQYSLDKSGFAPVVNTTSAPTEQSNQDATAKVGLTPIQQLQRENTSKPDATLNIPNIGVFNRQVNAFGEVTDKTITDNAPDESVVLRNEYNQKRKGILNPTVVVPQSQLTPENNFGLTAPNMQSSTDATAVSTPIKQVQGAPQNEPVPPTPEQQFRQKVNNNLTQLDKETIAKTGEYAMKVTSDPVAAGFITKAVLGDDMAISQKRQIDKGYSVPQSDLYQTGQVGISSFIAALDKKYADDPQNADYLKQRADLENQSSTLIDKFPEYKTSQLTKAVAIELNKLHPEVANDAAMAQLYLPEIKKEMGLSDEDVKAIDFDNYPTSNFITSTIAPIYKGALGLGAFGTRVIGTALGADSDFLNSRITEMQKSPTFFDDINTMQNTGQTVDTNKTSPTFLQDVADPNKGKYNYNFHTISNAIGNGVGQLAWFVYGSKGIGAAANKVAGLVSNAATDAVSLGGLPFKLSPEATNEVGMAGLMIGQGYEDNYQKARTVISDKPEDEWKRNAFALLQGSLDYLGFRVLGNVVKGLPPTAEKEIGQVFKDAPNLAAVNKTALQSKLTNILQGLGEAGKEAAFVGTATTASEIAKAAVINVLGNDKAAEEENKQLPDVITSSIASLPFSMFLPIVGAKIIAGGQSKIQNENIYNAGLNPESYKGDANKLFDMGAINQQQLNDRIQVINTAHDVVKSIPSDVFDNLNHNQRVAYVNSKIKEAALKAKTANIQDDALSDFYANQIKNEVAKRSDILNGGGKEGEYPQSINNQVPVSDGKPTDGQIADDVKNKRFATFTYNNEAEVPDAFKDKITTRSTGGIETINDGKPFVRVTVPQSEADYELSKGQNNTEAPMEQSTGSGIVKSNDNVIVPQNENDIFTALKEKKTIDFSGVSDDKLGKFKRNTDASLFKLPDNDPRTVYLESALQLLDSEIKKRDNTPAPTNEVVNKVEQPTEKDLVSQAKDLVNRGVVKGYTADVLKESANSNPEEFQQHLKDISEQANDPKSNKATVDTYGKELVDIAQKLNPVVENGMPYQTEVANRIGTDIKDEFVKIGNPYIDADINENGEAVQGLPVSELNSEKILKQRIEDLKSDNELEKESSPNGVKEINDAISFLESYLPKKSNETNPTTSTEVNKPIAQKLNPVKESKIIEGNALDDGQMELVKKANNGERLGNTYQVKAITTPIKAYEALRSEGYKEVDFSDKSYDEIISILDSEIKRGFEPILVDKQGGRINDVYDWIRNTAFTSEMPYSVLLRPKDAKVEIGKNNENGKTNTGEPNTDLGAVSPKLDINSERKDSGERKAVREKENAPITQKEQITTTPTEINKPISVNEGEGNKYNFSERIKANGDKADEVNFEYNGKEYTLHTDADGYGVYGVSKKGEDTITFLNKKGEKSNRYKKIFKEIEPSYKEWQKNKAPKEKPISKPVSEVPKEGDIVDFGEGREKVTRIVDTPKGKMIEAVNQENGSDRRNLYPLEDYQKALDNKEKYAQQREDRIASEKEHEKYLAAKEEKEKNDKAAYENTFGFADKETPMKKGKILSYLNKEVGSKGAIKDYLKDLVFNKSAHVEDFKGKPTIMYNEGERTLIAGNEYQTKLARDYIAHLESLPKDAFNPEKSKPVSEAAKPTVSDKFKNKYKDKVKGLFDTGESKNAEKTQIKTDNGKQSINQYVSRAKEVANKLFPDAKFETFDTHADFEKAGGIEGSRGTAITDSKGNKTILLNLAQMREDGVGKTAFHEVIHPIVSEVFGKTPEELVPVWNDITATMSDIKGMDKVWEHLVFYGENKTPVEGITEFLTQIADGNIKVDDIPKAKQSKFLDLINRLFEKLGINYKFDSGVDLHNFAKEIKKAFDTGDVEGLKKYTDKGSKKLSDNVNADTSSDKEALVTNMVKDAMDEGLTSLNEVRDAITSGLENNSPELKKLIEDAYNKLSSKGEVEGNGGDNVPPEQRGVDNNSDSFSEWSRVNLDSLSKIKDQFRKIGIGWDERAESAMRNLQKRSKRGERLYDTAVREMDNFYKSLSKDKTPRFNTDDQVAMHFLKIATEQSMARLTEDAMSKNAFSNVESIGADILNEQFNRVNAVLGAMRSESGVGLAYGNVEARLSPDYGLKVRQMQMIRANKGEPLSDEQNNFVKDHWEKEKELNKREQQVREQAIKDEFEKRISDLQSDFEKRIKDLKEKKASEPNTKNQKRKLSSTLRDISKRIRETNEFDKFIKGDKGDIKAAGVTFDMKEGLAQAIDYIAKAVEGTEKLSDAIRKAVEKYKGDLDADGIKEFRDKIHGLITKASLPDRELSFDKIKELAIKDQATTITKEMVGKNLIKDFIDSHIGDFDKKDILNEATKRLQEVLPDVTKEQVTEAYLKKGEFLLPQKSRLDEDVAKEKMALKKIAKDELTANQQQKIKLQEEKQRALKRIEELKGLQERGEYTTDQPSKPVILAKQDAELINIDRERNKLESAYRKEADKIKENQNHIVQRVLDTARSLWVAVLIGRPKTFAKIAWFMVARPTSEVLSKLSFGRAFGLIAPDLASAAKVGGESNSTRSIGKMSAAFFRNMGAEKLQRLYENGEKRYAYAKAAYEQYKNTEGHSEKKLAALKRDMDNKMFDSLGNIMYQFIGGSSIKDAIETLVHRTNIIEKQFGKIRDESIKDGNGLDKFNYIMGFIGRSHSALKTLSGRASFAGAFMARIEAAFERGQDLGTNKLLEIAHESYLDWERGKYQQSNWISDTWNRIVTSIDEGKFNKEKWNNYNKSAQLLARTEVAITRVPVNIIHEEVAEYLAGAFRAPILAAKAYNRAKAQAIEEGYTKKIEVNNGIEHGTTKEEFNKRVGEIVRDMDGEQAAKVMRLFRKGGMGLGLYAAALIWGGIHFGIFPHKGQKKVKKEQDLAPDELNPGQIMFGKDKLGDVTSAMISHTPALWDTFMGLGMAKSYYDDVNNGRSTMDAAARDLVLHLKIIESNIPQAQIISPTETVQKVGTGFKKNILDSWGLTDGVDTKGGLPKNSPVSNYLDKEDIEVSVPERYQLNVGKDKLHPFGRMTDEDYSKFKKIRSSLLNERLSQFLPAAQSGGLSRDKIQKEIKSIAASSTTIAKEQMIAQGIISPINSSN